MRPFRPSLAETIGVAALLLALPVAFWSPALAIVVLSLFLLFCVTAPFFPAFGFFLPVIHRGAPEDKQVALTFDDGPWPASTPVLLDLLARYHLKATFFVVGRQAAQHPELIALILRQGHDIGNHSLRHDPFLMLRTRKTLHTDIQATQEILKRNGVIPLVFRPPSGITNPRLKGVLAAENLLAVTYSCRALDGGNRNVRNLAGKIRRRLHPGAIVMLHDVPPRQPAMTERWQQELDILFSALRQEYHVVSLEKLIHHPVCARIPIADGFSPCEQNALAGEDTPGAQTALAQLSKP